MRITGASLCWALMAGLASCSAANILAFGVISYQDKGRLVSSGSTGHLLVREVHAGGPLIPGSRVA